MSYTASNMGSLPNGNLTGNTLGSETYRQDAAGLLLQNVDNMDGSSGKGLPWKRIQSGLDVNKPVAGSAGTVYIATDTGLIYFDDGSTLHKAGGPGVVDVLGDSLLGVAATNITFSSIPATYKHLRIVFSGRGDGAVATDNVRLQLNADTAANYTGQATYITGASAASSSVFATTSAIAGVMTGASDTAGSAGGGTVDILDYASTVLWKTLGGTISPPNQQATVQTSGVWKSTAAIASIKLFPSTSTNFIAGTRATLYGIA